jgi:hypothetical protein
LSASAALSPNAIVPPIGRQPLIAPSSLRTAMTNSASLWQTTPIAIGRTICGGRHVEGDRSASSSAITATVLR